MKQKNTTHLLDINDIIKICEEFDKEWEEKKLHATSELEKSTGFPFI